MRRRTPLGDFGLILGFSLIVAAAFPAQARAGAAADSTADPDSAGVDRRWLPVPEEDLESVEALDEDQPGLSAGAIVRTAVTRGRLRMRRIGFRGARDGLEGELGVLVNDGRLAAGARMTSRGGRLALAGGRVSVTRAPPLFAETMRLTRSGRRVPAPRSGVISAAPSLGASAGAIDGGAIAVRGDPSAWVFAGVRGDSREPLGGAGIGIVSGRTRVSAALGAARDVREAGRIVRCASISARYRDRGRGVAVEALGSSEGRAVLAEVSGRADAVLLAARWRYRSWTARNVAAELSAETRGSDSRLRLTWRSWSGNASADDGLLEVEATASRRGAAPVRLRLGAAGLGRDGNRSAAREAYGMIDATLARDERRSLGVHVVRRASSSATSQASSATLGARLDVRAGRIGVHSLLIESTRIQSGAAAWGVELTPSGATTLRARAKAGIWVTARGGFGARGWRVGYALARGEDAAGPGPWSGTMWVRLDRN